MEKENTKVKKPFIQKLFFWLFVLFIALGVFLLWSLRDVNYGENSQGDLYALLAAIGAICLGILFGCLGFIKYLRNKTVAGGLFLTTALSTASFLGASQLVGLVLAPASMAAAEGGANGNMGINLVVVLAQVGLFGLWFAFLLFSIRVALNPLRKINSSLDNIMEGREVHRLRLGKSRQYKEIEQKLITLSKKRKRR